MPQKHRRDFLIVSVGMPRPLIEAMKSEIESQHRNSRFAPLTVSEFIRRAIERDLDHGRRARVTRPRRKKL